MAKRKTNEEFILELKEKFPNIESLEEYKSALTKIKFKCLTCGHEFYSKPNTVLNSTYGCPKCSIKGVHNKLKDKGREHFYKSIEGKYIVLTDYIDAKTYVKCKCIKCGHKWNVRPYNINNGYGCPECKKQIVADKHRTPLQEAIDKAEIVHNYYYDYSKVDFKTTHDKVCIICPKHGEFFLRMNDHIKGCGCPKCRRSHGESLVESVLLDLNLDYSTLFKIEDPNGFRKTNTAYIDFRILYNDLEYFIEYNGELYYISKKHFGGDVQLKIQQDRDLKVREYCINHNIKLLEIPYTTKDLEIRDLIKKFIYE